jgi:hypothetical protein
LKIRMRCRLPRRLRILPRAAALRAWGLLVAVAVLFGALHAGARYYYCEGVGLSITDPCARVAGERAPCPLESFERAPFDCCQVIAMPSMPQGARAVEPRVPAARVVALLPPPTDAVESPARALRVAWKGERWRGPPRPADERRARLMVFLT